MALSADRRVKIQSFLRQDGKMMRRAYETTGENIIALRDRRAFIRTGTTRPNSGRPLILLLQGPVGPFFSHVMRAFEQDGCDVLKINFNGGDWFFCAGRGTLNFTGSLQDWSDWLEAFVQRSRPAAIVLFGDSRPYHRIAVAVAKPAGVPVWCLEEGYARPHFVTCELGGNNARSPLRRDLDDGEEGLPEAPLVPARPVVGNLFQAMAKHAVAYYTARALGRPFFFGNVAHRSRGLMTEAFLWSRGFWRKIAFYHANHSFLQHLIEHLENRYFVVALQVHDDQQLLRHGRGWTMERLITETIQSFARHADPGHRLVLKVHPMDRGHRSYRSFAMRIAGVCGCADRVHVVDDGSIGLMIRHSLGVITVNSTSGLLALNHGKPLLVLGSAVYGLAELVTDGADAPDALDRFWSERRAPDSRKVRAFNRRLHAESQINGSFYLRDWLAATSEQVVARVRGQAVSLVPGQNGGLAGHGVERQEDAVKIAN